MAAISPAILQADQKADGTWNVKIRIWHNGKPAYIDTVHFVGKNQVKLKNPKDKESKTLVIKDDFVLDRIAPELKKYRDWITDNAELVEELTAKEVKKRLLAIRVAEKRGATGGGDGGKIDFLRFCDDYLTKMEASSKSRNARPLRTVYNSLVDYFKSDSLDITKIRYQFLLDYEEHLKRPRVFMRMGGGGKEYQQQQAGLSRGGLTNHMRDLRNLFKRAMEHFNDEDLGIVRVAHYPFKKYKVGQYPLTENRSRDIYEFVLLRDLVLPKGSLAELARDMCLISFYMLGMNPGDIYEMPEFSKIGKRYGYRRAKTRDRRKDEAFISIKVIPEVRPLLKKYAGELQKRYSTKDGLNKAIDDGLKVISRLTGVPDLDLYDWRHSVGTWARRLCGYSKSDVGEALNQNTRTVTDIYIAVDWSLIDRVQASVVALTQAYGPHPTLKYYTGE